MFYFRHILTPKMCYEKSLCFCIYLTKRDIIYKLLILIYIVFFIGRNKILATISKNISLQ